MKAAEKGSANNEKKGATANIDTDNLGGIASPRSFGVTPYRAIDLPDLFRIEEWQDEIPWRPFVNGAEIHRLYGDGKEGATAVLIRFREESQVPVHLHPGYEHIFILAGEQRDQNAVRSRGAFTVNPPGTVHGVSSKAGTIVLVIYEKPVVFL
ncbi:MAG TPA: cupin domain-containing protein [Chthoniobacterales bacterium]|nr:cupin domain-containing protein [Chthoniobacterales bacterium]